jgi:enoyl-CoA hydratase/carnithine racemase
MTLEESIGVLRGLAEEHGRVRTGRVALERADGIATVLLDHPEARSAVTLRMMWALAEHVRALQAFDGHAVVIASTDPRAFCAGGHLDELLGALDAPERASAMASAMAVVLDALRDLPVPTVAAVHALAVGGGAELSTAADFRVLARGARVHFVHTRLGVVPGWGGSARLSRIVGPTVALRWLALAEPVDADECARVGFADRVVEGDARAEAVRLAHAWRDRGDAVRAAKAQLRADPPGQAACFAARWGGAAHREALARGSGRRAP